MDFLIICVFIFLTAIISRFFFKTMLTLSIAGALIYLSVPAEYKKAIDSKVSLSNLSIAVNGLLNLSKKTADRLVTESEKIKAAH